MNYINELKETFESAKTFCPSIKDIFRVATKCSNDDLCKLIIKHHSVFYGLENKKIEFTEAEQIINPLSIFNNILIKAYCGYIQASSSLYAKSELPNICIEYIEFYFKNLNAIDFSCGIDNLFTILRWTVFRFPQYKSKISSIFYDLLMTGEKDNIFFLKTLNYVVAEERVFSFLSEYQYEKIYEKFLENQYGGDERIKLYFYLLNSLANIKRFKTNFAKKIKKDLCDYTLKNIEYISNDRHLAYMLFQIRDYMKLDESYNSKTRHTIEVGIEKFGKNIKANMQSTSIKLPDNICNSILLKKAENEEKISMMSNEERIVFLLSNLYPVPMSEIEAIINQKGHFDAYANEIYINDFGDVFDYKYSPDRAKNSIESGPYISFFTHMYISVLYAPFIQHFEMDDKVRRTIKAIVSGSKLARPQKVEKIVAAFCSFFEKSYENSIMNIVFELEDSLRFYFENKGFSIRKIKSDDMIGLSDILNYKPKNEYRDELYATIDENFYHNLVWFLVDKYGFGLRNKIAHSYENEKIEQTYYAIFIALQVLILYWGFNDCLKKDSIYGYIDM